MVCEAKQGMAGRNSDNNSKKIGRTEHHDSDFVRIVTLLTISMPFAAEP